MIRHGEWPPVYAVDARDWASFPGPLDYEPAAISRSLRALAATTAQTSEAAYHGVLFAIGNNHAGTLYPWRPPLCRSSSAS